MGGGSAGAVGWMYAEFPETCILTMAFLNAFTGLEADAEGLHFKPRLPADVESISAQRIEYWGALFDFEVTRDSVTVECTRNPNDTAFQLGDLVHRGPFHARVPVTEGSALLRPAGAEGT